MAKDSEVNILISKKNLNCLSTEHLKQFNIIIFNAKMCNVYISKINLFRLVAFL